MKILDDLADFCLLGVMICATGVFVSSAIMNAVIFFVNITTGEVLNSHWIAENIDLIFIGWMIITFLGSIKFAPHRFRRIQ